jgi:hypothetical protein
MFKKSIMIMLACTFAAVLSSCSKPATVEYASVSFFIGDVTKNGAPVAMGDQITEKDSITTGPQSSCDVKVGSSIIRVKEKSKMVFASIGMKGNLENTTLDLGEGRMLCKPKKLMKEESFMVKTPTAIAAVRGTEFTVESDAQKTTRIKVYDGSVKVAKRVTALEDKVNEVIQVASPVGEKESVIITEQEVAAAEKKVEKAIADSKGADLTDVITSSQKDISVGEKDIQKFKVEDFKKETSELISIQEKDPSLLKQIKDASKLPAPEGRLLVTRYEVYFIKNGRVEWEGKVIEPPVKEKDKIYIASEDFIFCASIDGPVFWKKELINDGKLEVKDKTVTAFVKGRPMKLDITTGKEKM